MPSVYVLAIITQMVVEMHNASRQREARGSSVVMDYWTVAGELALLCKGNMELWKAISFLVGYAQEACSLGVQVTYRKSRLACHTGDNEVLRGRREYAIKGYKDAFLKVSRMVIRSEYFVFGGFFN